MKDVKFRVWIFAGMDEGEHPFMDEVYSINFEDQKVFWTQFTEFSYFDECNLMQYTGIKDRNGKDIYEGDIVRTTHLLIPVGVIKYWGIYHSFEIESKDGENCIGNKYRWDDIEVIGNIYENPELLK